MEEGPFYTYVIFVLVACVASVHLLRTCGQTNSWCKALYVLCLTVLLYIIFDTAMECATSKQTMRQKVRKIVLQGALLALVLALFTHRTLWNKTLV